MTPEHVAHVLNDPLAQQLLNSNIPARLAYTGVDRFPRVVPIGFIWNGERFVMCTLPYAPKVRVGSSPEGGPDHRYRHVAASRAPGAQHDPRGGR